jgi:hypothetical protein
VNPVPDPLLFFLVVPGIELGPPDLYPSLIQEEIKRRLNSGNACYHSVQNLLSSRLLRKNTYKLECTRR